MITMSVLIISCSSPLDQPIIDLDENQLNEISLNFPETSKLVEGVKYYSPKLNTPRHLELDEVYQKNQSYFLLNIDKLTFNDLIEYKKLRDKLKVNPRIQFGNNEEKILMRVDSLQRYFKPFYDKECIEKLVSIEILDVQKEKKVLPFRLTNGEKVKSDIIKFKYLVKLSDEEIDLINFDIKLNGIPSDNNNYIKELKEIEDSRYTLNVTSFPRFQQISPQTSSYIDQTNSFGDDYIRIDSKLKSFSLTELKNMTSVKLLRVKRNDEPVYYKVTPKILQSTNYPSSEEFFNRILIDVNYLDRIGYWVLPDPEEGLYNDTWYTQDSGEMEIWRLLNYSNSIIDYIHENMSTIMVYNFLSNHE